MEQAEQRREEASFKKVYHDPEAPGPPRLRGFAQAAGGRRRGGAGRVPAPGGRGRRALRGAEEERAAAARGGCPRLQLPFRRPGGG
eukprot:1611815-Lingulodinium_polyedra.AAC.1